MCSAAICQLTPALVFQPTESSDFCFVLASHRHSWDSVIDVVIVSRIAKIVPGKERVVVSIPNPYTALLAHSVVWWSQKTYTFHTSRGTFSWFSVTSSNSADQLRSLGPKTDYDKDQKTEVASHQFYSSWRAYSCAWELMESIWWCGWRAGEKIPWHGDLEPKRQVPILTRSFVRPSTTWPLRTVTHRGVPHSRLQHGGLACDAPSTAAGTSSRRLLSPFCPVECVSRWKLALMCWKSRVRIKLQ